MQTENKKVLPFGEDLGGANYILKPGRHQFAPGSHAVHQNDNLSDDEAEWYLEKYPHISSLFETIPKTPPNIGEINYPESVESQLIGEIKNTI